MKRFKEEAEDGVVPFTVVDEEGKKDGVCGRGGGGGGGGISSGGSV